MVASDVGRGNYPGTLGKFGKDFGRALERHDVVGRIVKCEHGEHFVADAKEKVFLPLNVFGYMRQRQAESAN